ncbi:MAG: tRNA 2-thiouridine(34) synthase MnmA [Candidatus Baltobacteraceae bacterium]
MIAAMSGGVDSAVAAGLLVEAGYGVVGVTMKMYSPSKAAHAKSCCGIEDFDDARKSANVLGIPHYVLDFEETFRRTVIDRFVHEYASGRTPNPCVSCNNFVKLGTLRRYADSIDAPYIATGHYARVEHRQDGPHLLRGTHAKDQAYALAQLAPDQLARLLLPLGELDKKQTRAHARRMGLRVHDKAESQDICFVEGGDYREVLARVQSSIHQPGAIVSNAGTAVGSHNGVAHFTVGQRSGLPGGSGFARYVTRIDAQSNTIVIGREDELDVRALIADEVNLIRGERFGQTEVPVLAMVRYRCAPAAAMACVRDGLLHVRFQSPLRAVSPGQLVALFDEGGEEVLGAATIRESV